MHLRSFPQSAIRRAPGSGERWIVVMPTIAARSRITPAT